MHRSIVCLLVLFVTWPRARAGEPEPLDLGALLAEADRASPELLARAARAAAAAEVAEQRAALPDPRLSASYTNDGLSSFTLGESKFANLMVRWDQDVPARKVRAKAADVAAREHDVAVASESAARARLRLRVIALYVAIWRAERNITLLEEGRGLLTTAVEAARARYESGEGSQQGVLRSQTEVRRAAVELESLARDRRAAEIALGEALGRSGDARFGPAAELPGTSPLDGQALEALAAGSGPGTLEARAGVARAEAAVDSARVQTKPEWGWMAAYQYLGSLDPMVMGGVTVRLPLWKDAKQARGLAEAERSAEAATHDRDAVEIAARVRVRDLVSEVESIERRRALYGEAVLPEGGATLEASRAAFSAGLLPMTDVLDDLVRLVSDRRAAVDLEARRVLATAELEAATGTPLLVIGGGR
jgi:outer membrane protein TolC